MANGTETTRPDKMNRKYRTRDGEETGKLTPEVAGVIWEVIENGERVEIDLAELFPGKRLPEPCLGMCAAAFGINTAVGNTVGNTRIASEMVERLQDRVDSLIEGEWSSGREGPRTKHVVDAWAASIADRGTAVTDELLAKLKTALEDGTTTVKKVLENSDVAAKFAAQKAERAVEAAKAKAAVAQNAKGTADPLSLLG